VTLLFPVIVLGSHLTVRVADRPPTFDMTRTCNLDLMDTYGTDTGQRDKSCVRDEQNARRQIQRQWLKFPAWLTKPAAYV
jgi:hypothetical protein